MLLLLSFVGFSAVLQASASWCIGIIGVAGMLTAAVPAR